MSDNTVEIIHVGVVDEHTFSFILKYGNATQLPPVQIQAPNQFPAGEECLEAGLNWYLEEYISDSMDAFMLEKSDEGSSKRAEAVFNALKEWGRQSFQKLFRENAKRWYEHIREEKRSKFRIVVVSAVSSVLSWPWEALYDDHYDDFLAFDCDIVRQLPNAYEQFSYPIQEGSPLRVLAVIARPEGKLPVGYGNLLRQVMENAENEQYPVEFELLRPSTYESLEAKLREKGEGYYHIFHFDGHGKAGQLIFEKDAAAGGIPGEDSIPAEKLESLFRQYCVPLATLCACNSATESEREHFSSVAMSLLRAGVHSVVAMSSRLWLGGAQQFVPTFYDCFFKKCLLEGSASLADAIQAGRIKMRNHSERVSDTQLKLKDWMMPVLYQRPNPEKLPLPSLSTFSRKDTGSLYDFIYPKIKYTEDYSFVGRGQEIHLMEQLRKRTNPVILIHGVEGVGKTEFVWGFLNWLRMTGDLRKVENGTEPVFWTEFRDVRCADDVLKPLYDKFLSDTERNLSADEKINKLAPRLKTLPVFLVWDRCEDADKVPLPFPELQRLSTFLKRLNGGKTRVFMISQNKEIAQKLFQSPVTLSLSGFENSEECRSFCEAVKNNCDGFPDWSDDIFRRVPEFLRNPTAIKIFLLRHNKKAYSKKEMDKLQTLHPMDGREAIQFAFQYCLPCANQAMGEVLKTLDEMGARSRVIKKDKVVMALKTLLIEDYDVDKCLYFLQDLSLLRLDWNKEEIIIINPALHLCVPNENQKTS